MVELSDLLFWRRKVEPSFLEVQKERYDRARELLDANASLSPALEARLDDALADAKKSISTMVEHRGVETWRGQGYLTQLDRATARLVEKLEMLEILEMLDTDADAEGSTEGGADGGADGGGRAFFAYTAVADHIDRVDELAMAVTAIRYEPVMITVLAYGFVLIPFLNLASIVFGAALLLFYGARDPRARFHGMLVLILVTAQLLVVQFLHLSYSIL